MEQDQVIIFMINMNMILIMQQRSYISKMSTFLLVINNYLLIPIK
jgi:hypothetical protein